MSENNQNQETVILSQAELVTINRMTDEIRKDLAAAQQSLLRACIRIAEVRDRKLYKLLKCRNFEEYCEECLGIKRRQGLKYAAIGSYLKNVQSTAHFQEKFFQQLRWKSSISSQRLTMPQGSRRSEMPISRI